MLDQLEEEQLQLNGIIDYVTSTVSSTGTAAGTNRNSSCHIHMTTLAWDVGELQLAGGCCYAGM